MTKTARVATEDELKLVHQLRNKLIDVLNDANVSPDIAVSALIGILGSVLHEAADDPAFAAKLAAKELQGWVKVLINSNDVDQIDCVVPTSSAVH